MSAASSTTPNNNSIALTMEKEKKKRPADPSDVDQKNEKHHRKDDGTATSNRFDALKDDDDGNSSDGMSVTSEDLDNENEENTIKKISPIIISGGNITQETKTKLHLEIIKNFKGTTIGFSREKVTIYPKTDEDATNLMSILDTWKLSYHTFGAAARKLKKYVIKGLPVLNEEDIDNDLREQGFTAIKIRKMKPGPKSNPEYPLYYAAFDSNTNAKLLRNIKFIYSIRVRWEKYKNPKGTTQCFRCQSFSHGTSHCHREPRCLKCIKPHLTKDCDKPADAKPQCVNCRGEHPANASDCEAYRRHLRMIEERRRPAQTPKQHKYQQAPDLQNIRNFPPLQKSTIQQQQEHQYNTDPRIRHRPAPDEQQQRQTQQHVRNNFSEIDHENNINNVLENGNTKQSTYTYNNPERKTNEKITTLSDIIKEIKILETHCDLNIMFSMLKELNTKMALCPDYASKCQVFYNVITKYV